MVEDADAENYGSHVNDKETASIVRYSKVRHSDTWDDKSAALSIDKFFKTHVIQSTHTIYIYIYNLGHKFCSEQL